MYISNCTGFIFCKTHCTGFIFCIFIAQVSYFEHSLHLFHILYVSLHLVHFLYITLHIIHILYISNCTGFIFCIFQIAQVSYFVKLFAQVVYFVHFNSVARTLRKLRTSKGDYWIKQLFSSTASLLKMETSLKGKNFLPGCANSFLYEQFLIV